MIVLKKYFKITVVILFAVIYSSYGQTYTIKVAYDASSAGCHAASFGWKLSGNMVTIGSFSKGGNSMNINESQTFATVPTYTSFSLSHSSNCTPLRKDDIDCIDSYTLTKTVVEMLQGAYLGMGGCNGGVDVSFFQPNVSIENLDTASPTKLCAGFSLSLAAFPLGFPVEAYHWQYSTDNQSTWIDVPAGMNNTPTPSFTMQQLLGANHANYLNTPIYFRLGYTTRAFTTPLAITYSSCAPVAQYINYEAPKCNGNSIEKIEVFFKEKLKTGEDLSIIYVVNTDPAKTTPRFQNTALVTSFILDPATNLYKYSFPNLGEALENGNFYTVKYQARLNGQPMGSLQVSQQPFQYIDPAKMQFKITGQTQPTCFGSEDGTIDIEILSGELPYNFYVDNVLKTASKIDNLHYKITGLKANVLGYKIKVTDKNDCIEKL
ncbi:hypothetical protein EV143_10749 [Flavobacterium chryseum]|nr:hypothetical protein EV143_10749 [Flavobacterium sp. P3160]